MLTTQMVRGRIRIDSDAAIGYETRSPDRLLASRINDRGVAKYVFEKRGKHAQEDRNRKLPVVLADLL